MKEESLKKEPPQLEKIEEVYLSGEIREIYFLDENQLKQGGCRELYKSGKIMRESHYLDGELHGKMTDYAERGDVLGFEFYREGKSWG